MKPFLPIALVLLVAGLAAAAPRPQVSLSVQQKLDSDTEQRASRHSSLKEKEHSCRLTFQLRNSDPTNHNVKLEWFFVGNPLQSGLDNFVYDRGSAELSLPARSATNLVQESKSIGSKVSVVYSKTTKSGAKHLGYIVTLTQETNLLQMITAPSSLERIARNPEALAALLAAPAPN